MRNRLLCCVAFLLATSCVKRIAPTPPGERNTLTGVPLPFDEPAQLPEGSQVIWDFGDGTPPATGAHVTHAFNKDGVYTIVETIRDKDGESRTGRTHVSAVLRSVPLAVPADVRAALLAPAPWKRMALHRQLADKLSLGANVDEVAHAVSEAVGFDVLDGKAVEANGFDPAKGVALFTVPQDPEALVLAVGILDEQKALTAARKLLSSEAATGHPGAGGFQLTDGKLDNGVPVVLGQNAAGDKVGVVERYGYLYLRTAGASDPLLSLRSVAALPPDKGLAVDPGYMTAFRHVGSGDVVFYSRASDKSGGLRFSNELGATAFAVIEKPEVLQIRLFSQLKNLQGDQMVTAFKPLRDPPDLAGMLPAGASAYLRLSAAPNALWNELSRMSGQDAARLRDRLQESTGLDLEKDLIPSFSGNIGVALYLDATSLIEAIMGEEVGSFDRSAFLVTAQLTNSAKVQAALQRAMKSRPQGDKAELAGASVYRLGDAAIAAVKGDVLFLALGGLPATPPAPARKGRRAAPKKQALTLDDLGLLARALQPAEKSMSLSQEFKRIGVAGFQVPGQQNFWFNIAGVVRGIERAGTEHGGAASSGARLFAERAADLRDALLEARPGKDGIDADLWIRFLTRKAEGSGSK